MTRFNNISNQKFGRLTILPKWERKGNHVYWLCLCSCGTKKYISASNLYNGHAQSCGCFNRELIRTRSVTHGKSKTPTYNIWKGMRKRCLNPTDKSFHNYGGRGISVCNRWSKYENFYSDIGERPSNKHSIDRIDNNGNYEPNNCQWALKETQMNNMRTNINLTYKHKTLTVRQWSKLSKVSYHTFWQRLYRLNWNIEKALTAQNQNR